LNQGQPAGSFEHVGNIVDVIRSHAAAQPDGPAIIDADQVIPYAQLHERILRTAGHLADRGVRRDDRVGLALHDHADHLILILSAACLGAATVSLNWRSKLEEKRLIAEAFGLKLLVNDPDVRTPAGVPALGLDEAWRDNVDRAVPRQPIGSARPLACRILLTSGTSGAPKGVELTHAGLMTWCDSVRLALGLRSHQRHLSVLPLGFTASVNFNLPHLLLGNTVDLFPSFFTPEEFVAAVKARGITSSIVVPTILRQLLALAGGDEPLLPELECLCCLGAPLTPDERRAAKRRLTPGFFEDYGASGAGSIAFLTPNDIDAKPDSVGKAAPFREVSIADASGRSLPAGQVGLLRCRGPGVATGFCNAVDADLAESFRDGWYYPGELARLDDDGFVYIVGRASEVILRGGINIYPAEIEQTLLRHPAVREAAVIGAPSAEHGEDIVAFVNVSDGTSTRDLLETCRRYLTAYKVPRAIIVLDDLPKNAAGKVVKAELSRFLPPEPPRAEPT
jgi:acyl-CoA synthetase (AMP-forming)/AMP-acid ligase II